MPVIGGFDKEAYWKRRHNTEKVKVPDGDKKKKDGTPRLKTIEVPRPLRGQGEPFNPVGGPAKVGGKPVSTKALRNNSKRARKEALKNG